MPLIRQWAPSANSQAAVWRIEEDEEFFLKVLSAGPAVLSRLVRIKPAKRRLEFLAGRHLLRILVPGFPLRLIKPDEHDKPRLPNDAVRFSVSHSYPFAAAVVSTTEECGIDIQCPHPRIGKLLPKFLSEDENILFRADPSGGVLAWSMKEAVYKWQGRRGVDFIRHLPVTSLQNIRSEWIATVVPRLLPKDSRPAINGYVEPEFALSTAMGVI